MKIRNTKAEVHKKQTALQPVLSLVASKWSIAVIGTLQHDTLRFNEIQKSLPNATQKVLTDTLRRLQRSGMIERTLYPTIPPQVEYKLTSVGLELLNISEILTDWAEKNQETIKRAQKAYDHRIIK